MKRSYEGATNSLQQQHRYDPRQRAHLRYYRTDEKGYFPYDLVIRFIMANQKKESGLSPDCRILRLQVGEHGHVFHFPRINEAYLVWQLKTKLPNAVHIGQLMPVRLHPTQFNHFSTPEDDERALALRRRFANNSQSVHRHHPEAPHVPPKLQNRSSDDRNFVATPHKELVFDLDIPDYDRFCGCGRAKMLCHVCWLHLEGSYFILQFILTHLYGYSPQNLLYVFSGSKGFHCFVNDSRAMRLTGPQRLFLYNSIAVKNGGESSSSGHGPYNKNGIISDDSSVAYQGDRQLMEWMKLYEPERRAVSLDDKLTHLFTELVLKSRDLLANNIAFREWIMSKARLHYPSCQERIRQQWQESLKDKSSCTSVGLWQILCKFDAYGMLSVSKQPLVPFSQFIIYRLYYPIIDQKPLLMDQTIKLPFAIHPATKNIALPFDEEFILSENKNDAIISLAKLYQHEPNSLPKAFIRGKQLLEQWLPQYKPLW